MEEVGKILPGVFKRQLHRSDALLVDLLVPLWPRIVGKAIARQCRPVAFAAGTLTIVTSCPTWAIQFRQLSGEIRAVINRYLGSDWVKKLKVRQDPSVNCAELFSGEKGAGCTEPARSAWPDSAARLEADIKRVLERSYTKYFARRDRKVN